MVIVDPRNLCADQRRSTAAGIGRALIVRFLRLHAIAVVGDCLQLILHSAALGAPSERADLINPSSTIAW